MKPGRASRTALGTALFRAQHQRVDGARIFADPFAVAIVGEELLARDDAAKLAATARGRNFVAARARLAEDLLAEAVARGVRRYLVLGAGLDTFALRNPYPDLEVIEIDHPDTQADKLARLARAGLPAPRVRYLAVDFACESLADAFARGGLADGAPAFASWLGVSYYLPRESTEATLHALAGIGSAVVLDFYPLRETLSPAHRAMQAVVAERVAAIGEPFVSYYAPADLAELARASGFAETRLYPGAELVARYRGDDSPDALHFAQLLYAA